MEKNFTSINIDLLHKKYKDQELAVQSFDFNSIFLILIVITLAILSTLLFILIQKKMMELGMSGVFA